MTRLTRRLHKRGCGRIRRQCPHARTGRWGGVCARVRETLAAPG